MGIVQTSSGLLPELGMIGGFIGGLAAVAALCTQLLKKRKQAIQNNLWNKDFLKTIIENEMRERKVSSCECIEILDFDGLVESDGDVCKIIIQDTDTLHKCTIEVSTAAATFCLKIIHM